MCVKAKKYIDKTSLLKQYSSWFLLSSVTLKPQNDTVHDFYNLLLEIYCYCDSSISLFILRLIMDQKFIWNFLMIKMTHFCNLVHDMSSLHDYAYPLMRAEWT